MMKLHLKILQRIPNFPQPSKTELSNIINELEKGSNESIILTTTTTNYIINSLFNYPYETNAFLNYVTSMYYENSKLVIIMNDLYMESFYLCMEQLNSTDNANLRSFYFLLSKINAIDENIISAIFSLINGKKLNRELVYFSLLANKDKDLIEKFIEYGQNSLKLCTTNPASLFEYIVYKNQHWFTESLQNVTDPNVDSQYFRILKLAYVTNYPNEFAAIEDCASNISEEELSSSLKYFVSSIKHIVEITNFCGTTSNANDIYAFASNNSTLTTLSKYIDLTNKENWRNIIEFLKIDNANSSIATFDSFCILCNILHCLQLCKNPIQSSEDKITSLLNETRGILLQLTNFDLQLELLENIYVLVFLRIDHLFSVSEYNHKVNEKFLCNEKELRLIVYFIKSCLDEIKRSNITQKSQKVVTLHRYIMDAVWRIELLSETIGNNKSYFESNEFMNFMLASPKNLVNLCLNNGNFINAHQVIQIFDMSEDELAIETHFMEDFIQLKDDIKKIFKIKKIQRETVNIQMQCDVCVQSTLKKFESYLFSQMQQSDESSELDIDLSNIISNKMFSIIFDLLITEPTYHKDCTEMMGILETYKTTEIMKNDSIFSFYNNLRQVFEIANDNLNLSFTNILNSALFDLNAEKYKANIAKHTNIIKTLDEILLQVRFESKDVPNYEKVSPKTFSQLGDLCQNFTQDCDTKINIFQRLLNYLKTFSQVLSANNDFSKPIIAKDNTCFTILNCDRTSAIGKLIYDQAIEPVRLEPLFVKLKLDLIYHIASNSFPDILLSTLHKSPSDQTIFKYIPTKDIITYIQKRNWLLAYLLLQIHNPYYTDFELNVQRTKCFENLLNLKKMQHLKELFLNGNHTLAALQQYIDPHCLLDFVTNTIEPCEQLESDIQLWNDPEVMTSSGTLETAEEVSEDNRVKASKWKRFFDILDALPEETLDDMVVKELWNSTLKHIITECYETDYYKYVQYIRDDELRISIILENVYNWPGNFCIDILRSVISMENATSDEVRKQLQNLCNGIEVYERIRQYTDYLSWNEIHNICAKTPEDLLQIVLETAEIDLLLNFMDIHPLSVEALLAINTTYFISIFNANFDVSCIENLLSRLPPNQSLGICQQLLKSLQKIDHLQFVIDRLLNYSSMDRSFLINIELSLKIISCFPEMEHNLLLLLIGRPLCIIEQLLMNTKLEKLSQIIQTTQEYFSNLTNVHEDEEEFDLNVVKMDALLRKYAEKSLDFRVITEPVPILRTESKLMQSFDSLSLGSDKQPFIIPAAVPTKLEWVQNDEALECMCCRLVTFSMFNRRHHCRRCGRLICGNCSLKRMQVPTYGDILVRVCNNCYEQSHQSTGCTSSSKSDSFSILYDNWQLTDNDTHNDIVREEFSYEHAPSVSLCLAILKYHSNNEECPKFLLSQCDKMLHLIQPIHSETHHEIDYSLVIKMIKSLAIAAKMISLQCSAKWAIAQSDRILSQIELLNLLTERGCLELIPKNCASGKVFQIDAGVLRKLRDKLLEREQWSLALEVSTKAGLDRSGVFAAWGKNCLKAGCLNLAREKFQKCFEKGNHFETSSDNFDIEDSLDQSRSRYQSKLSALSSVSETRPLKTPPLIDDIINILESKSCILNEKILKLHQTNNEMLTKTSSTLSLEQSLNVPIQADPAICIFNKLRSLSSIVAGNYDTYPSRECLMSNKNESTMNDVYIEPLFYNECIYYLTKYGSHSSILRFYVKHGEMKDCLIHILDNRLSTDVFVDVYMNCLEDGIIEIFQVQMSKIDSSLDVWKNYLKAICRHLEKFSLLNSLYQLQLFMGDYVRAAMTCIRFYTDDTNTYLELLNRINYLHRAQEHLKQDLEQEQWVEVAAVRKSSTSSQELLESYQEKSLTHSSLAMKMDSRTIDKHINTIWRQIEVTRILAEYETSQQLTPDFLKEIVKIGSKDDKLVSEKSTLPTLFGTQFEKIQIAILLIICGKNVEDSFGVAFRIIQDYHLKPVSVYCQAGKYLAKTENYNGIAQLVSCVRSSGVSDAVVTEMCDEMLILAVHTLTQANSTGPQLDSLIKLITDKAAKISAYIESKQLKSAYLLAVKHKRMGDIRRILKEAESLKQQNIKILCQKLLQTHSNLPSHSKE